MADVNRHGRLRWFGHLEQKIEEDWVLACRNMEVVGRNVGAWAGEDFEFVGLGSSVG